MAVPRLALDRPFTYLLPERAEAGIGSMVSVPFHGRMVTAWVTGEGEAVPDGRLLPVRAVRSPVRFFDRPMLSLLRWVGGRYVAPLATVIERSHPPRVASEEDALPSGTAPSPAAGPDVARGAAPRSVLERYGGAGLLAPGSTAWLRPLPGEEAEVCVDAVMAAASAGRTALVLVPEVEPLPSVAASVMERFGGRALLFAGGEPRERYRAWLGVKAGSYDVVVGTRPAVFAPLASLGLIWVSREVHPGHTEDRAPYYHVSEVARARARIEGAACVLSCMSPSVETAVACGEGSVRVARAPRREERAAAPLVEATPPEGEDRSPRLGRLLRSARSAALIVSRRGYGVARVCRSCGAQAACAACRGPIVASHRGARCSVCGAGGECVACGGRTFGVERGGTERVAEWAAGQTALPVSLEPRGGPRPGSVLVGTAAAVKDVGPRRVDVVAILDPDRALASPGRHAAERALATWMEAAAWAGPRTGGGRVLVQTRRPGHLAIQALVRWDPVPFLLAEAEQRRRAGFPPGHPAFRVTGGEGLEAALAEAGAETVLAASSGEGAGPAGGRVCLVAVPPGALGSFRRSVLRLAEQGVLTRVEAEPQA